MFLDFFKNDDCFNCCDKKIDDEIINDGRNYKFSGNFNIGTKLSKDARKFNIFYVTVRYIDQYTQEGRVPVWDRVFLCSGIAGNDGKYYMSGVSPYSFTSNATLSISVDVNNTISNITLQGNEYAYDVEYVQIVGVGVL